MNLVMSLEYRLQKYVLIGTLYIIQILATSVLKYLTELPVDFTTRIGRTGRNYNAFLGFNSWVEFLVITETVYTYYTCTILPRAIDVKYG